MNDYFVQYLIYNKQMFEQRFCMRKRLFEQICLQEHDQFWILLIVIVARGGLLVGSGWWCLGVRMTGHVGVVVVWRISDQLGKRYLQRLGSCW